MTGFPSRSEADGPQGSTALLTTGEQRPRRSRTRLLAAGTVAALALGSGGYALRSGLLTGGAPDPGAAPAPKARPVATRRPVAPAAPQPVGPPVGPPVGLPVPLAEPVGRDPFAPLYVVPVAGAAAPGPAVPGAAGFGGTTDPLANPSYPLRLISVAAGSPPVAAAVDVVVSGARRTVLLGQRFGVHGELVVLSVNQGPTGAVTGVTVQVGDDQPAALAIGETIGVR